MPSVVPAVTAVGAAKRAPSATVASCVVLLVSNTVKFTSAGGEVELRLERADAQAGSTRGAPTSSWPTSGCPRRAATR